MNKLILIVSFLSISMLSFGQSDSLRISDSLRMNELYKARLAKADHLFIGKDFRKAAQYYSEVLHFKLNDTYAKNMLKECNQYISDSEALKAKVKFFEKEGIKCLLNQDTACARENFLKALVIMDGCSVRNLLSFIDSTFTCCAEDAYRYACYKGEILYKCSRFKEAKKSFEEALAMQDKQYPKDMIKKCEELDKQKK